MKRALKWKRCIQPYLPVEADALVDEALLFLTLDADEVFLFLFWSTALSTASFGG